MKRKLIVMAVEYACFLIGSEWKRKQQRMKYPAMWWREPDPQQHDRTVR